MTLRRAPWPTLKRYDQDHLTRIAMPLGGIGTGCVSLGGRGDLRDLEVMNRPAKGFSPGLFAVLRAQRRGEPVVMRAVEGAIDPSQYEGAEGCTVPNHGLPRFRRCAFASAYPFGQVSLSDRDVPLRVRLEAFNPLIPGDTAASSHPLAVLRYVLLNPSDQPVAATLCLSIDNIVGWDGSAGKASRNRTVFRREAGLSGLFLDSAGVPGDAEQWGSLALTTTARSGISHRTAWAKLAWGNSLLDFWDDLAADGRLDEREAEGVDAPRGSLAVTVTVPPRSEREVTYLLTWHFPNRLAWNWGHQQHETAAADGWTHATSDKLVGNHYTTLHADAWAAARAVVKQLPVLEERSRSFVDAFCGSDLPQVVKEAALNNLSTLRTQTCFRTADGNFFGWEGIVDRAGSCFGSCTHVWSYEQATGFLFADLACNLRAMEFNHATRADGFMRCRIDLPLTRNRGPGGFAAADGQMGCLLKLHRDWQLSGDDDFLRALWPQARKALEFCWVPGGWDADRDGVMEGCQHNTMDVEYYGPNPQMGLWYLGALRAAAAMARHLGDSAFADDCLRLAIQGAAWIDANLFNGAWYEQHIRPPTGAIADGLRHPSMGARDLTNPDLQLGAGCLVDQLVGQVAAHVSGLGHLVDRDHLRRTNRAILTHNRRSHLHAHFNHLRSYALGDEAALLMCSYPDGRRPARPFPYYNEVMTGFEYIAAASLAWEGQTAEAIAVVADVRARYDGRKRNPFDEAECGHHYARAMASWGLVPALSGFHWDGVAGRLTLGACTQPRTLFWSNGSAWGTIRQSRRVLLVQVLHGRLALRDVLVGKQVTTLPKASTIHTGTALRVKLAAATR